MLGRCEVWVVLVVVLVDMQCLPTWHVVLRYRPVQAIASALRWRLFKDYTNDY